MRISLVLAAALLAGCGQQDGDQASGNAASNAAAPAKPKKPKYCFFKDSETKGWTASRDASGNVVIKGQAFRSDPRYQAVLGPAEVTGTTATLSPSIGPNATGYAAPGNWWDVTATIPNSSAVEGVKVECGPKTLAELKLPKA